jgi:hypothetical protein
MPYNLSLMATQGILTLRYYGTVDAKERLQSLNRILGMCREQRIRKVLVDFTQQESPTAAIDSAMVSSTLSEANVPATIRVAFVFPGGVQPAGPAAG